MNLVQHCVYRSMWGEGGYTKVNLKRSFYFVCSQTMDAFILTLKCVRYITQSVALSLDYITLFLTCVLEQFLQNVATFNI